MIRHLAADGASRRADEISTASDGDRITGVRSLPAVLGPDVAARIAVVATALPQAILVALLPVLGRPWHAAILLGQFVAMPVFDGMMGTALAVRGVM